MYYKNARNIFKTEAQQLLRLTKSLNSTFDRVIDEILRCTHKIVITGIGKSGLIGKKIAATLCSIGFSGIFIHTVEALHGDMGVIQSGDIVIFISNSGETKEIIQLVNCLINKKIITIAMTGDKHSSLAVNCDYTLDIGVNMEVCPFNFCPTASSTATLVMGDAIAMCLLKAKGMTIDDLRKNHPEGTLGKIKVIKATP